MSASSDPSPALNAAGQQTSAGSVKPYDRMADLKLHLREVIAEPTDLIKQGTAPPPYFFAIEPSGSDPEQKQKFAALLGAAALARILAGMSLVQSNPEHSSGGAEGGTTSTTHHYNLRNPSEYVAAFNEKTEATINAFTQGPLASMYGQCDAGAATSLNLEVTRAELHAMVLPRIFGGLEQVGKTHLAELDKVLTRFTAALEPFKVLTTSRTQGGKDREDPDNEGSGSQPLPELPELKHTVIVNYVKSVDITGGSGGIYVHHAYTRLVNFSVKPEQWASALQKSAASQQTSTGSSTSEEAEDTVASPATGTSKIGAVSRGWFGGKPKPSPPKPDERIKFTLNTTVIELEFDDAKYHANRAKFEGIFKNLAEDDEELGPIAESGGLNALGRKTCTIYQAGRA